MLEIHIKHDRRLLYELSSFNGGFWLSREHGMLLNASMSAIMRGPR